MADKVKEFDIDIEASCRQQSRPTPDTEQEPSA